MSNPKYGLDIDNVIADFITTFVKWAMLHGFMCFEPIFENVKDYYLGATPEQFNRAFALFKDKPSFWAEIKPFTGAAEALNSLSIKPACYITARPIPSSQTEEWLRIHGFPNAPVHTVATAPEKISLIQSLGLDFFVDDLPQTIKDLKAAGIPAYLFRQPHNRLAQISSNGTIHKLSQLDGVIAYHKTGEVLAQGGFVTPQILTPLGIASVLTPENKNAGYKKDEGKPRFDLLPWEALEEVAKVYTFGAAKYADNNWRKGMRIGRVFAATIRHLTAMICGQDRDEETGLLHSAHAAFGCLTLTSYLLNNSGIEDRWAKLPEAKKG
jgi:uncharacterized HAD superfamily protein